MNKKLFKEYEKLYKEVRERQARMNEIRAELSKLVNYRSRKVEHGGVRVTYSAGYIQVHWDKDELAAYAKEHPEILEFRIEKKIKPRRSIKVLP